MIDNFDNMCKKCNGTGKIINVFRSPFYKQIRENIKESPFAYLNDSSICKNCLGTGKIKQE